MQFDITTTKTGVANKEIVLVEGQNITIIINGTEELNYTVPTGKKVTGTITVAGIIEDYTP